jgi:gliding motility-associated-like protein
MKVFLTIPLAVFALFLSAQNPCTDVNLDLGPDASVCVGAVFSLNEHPIAGNYIWSGSPGLDCYNCPSPSFTATSAGVFILSCIVSTPTCNDTDVIRINVVNGLWPQVAIANDTALCTNALLRLGGPAVFGQIYSWTSNPPGFNSTIADPLPFPQTVSTTYYLTSRHPSCPIQRRDSVVVGVFSRPSISLIGGATFCLGDSVVLGNTVPEPQVTYSWTPNDGTLNDASLANPTATPTSGGPKTYFLTASNQGCLSQGNVPILAVDLAIQLSTPDTVSLCKGASLNMQASVLPAAAAMVNWSLHPNLQISADGLSATATPGVSTLYIASVQVSGCVKKDSVFAKLDSLPLLLGIVPEEISICSGQSVLLQAPPDEAPFDPTLFPNLTFSWQPGNPLIDVLPSLNVSPSDTTTYKRYVKNGACLDSAQAIVRVIPAPTVDVQQDFLSICPDSSAILLATALSYDTLFWSPNADLTCDTCLMTSAAPDGSITYYLQAEKQGCVALDSVVISILPLPMYEFPSDTIWCSGEVITLNTLPASVGNYHWTSVPAQAIDQVGQPMVALDVIGIQSITYFLEANNGCPVKDSFSISVTGAGLSVSPPETICPETPRVLVASAQLGGGQFVWDNGQTSQAINAAPSVTTTYTVNYTVNDCTFSESTTLTVNSVLPVIAFPSDVELCTGDQIILNSAFTDDATYQWTSNDGTFSSNDKIPPAQTPSDDVIYTVTATSADGCSITKTLSVTVYNGILSVAEDSIQICGGDGFIVSADATEPGSFLWTPANETVKTFSDTLFTEQTAKYYVQYTQGSPGNECISTDSVVIEVLKGFEVKIVSDPEDSFNAGESVTLEAILVPSQSPLNFDFVWTEGILTSIGNTQQVITASTTTDTSVTYRVVVTYENGCSQVESITFRVFQPKVNIPNAFTPNGDGSNDVFRLAVSEGIARIESFEIWDRWGKKVFESTEPDASWDGRVDGENAASDVYVYKIRWRRGDGSLVPASGEVTLLR